MLAPGAFTASRVVWKMGPMQRGPLPSHMVCQDARRAFPYMVAGEIPLTEWALLERHVSSCDECRTELERLRQEAAERARVRQHQRRRTLLTATTMAAVIVAAGFYLHQYGMPAIPRPDFSQLSTLWPSAPSEPMPSTPAPPAVTKPTPATSTRPTERPSESGRVSRPTPAPPPATPTAAAPRPAAVTPPPPAAKSEAPPARATAPSPASAATTTASDERMPTQGSTGRVINAAPSAEAMPTQAPPPARNRP